MKSFERDNKHFLFKLVFKENNLIEELHDMVDSKQIRHKMWGLPDAFVCELWLSWICTDYLLMIVLTNKRWRKGNIYFIADE